MASCGAPERALLGLLWLRAGEVVHGGDHAALDAQVLLDDLHGARIHWHRIGNACGVSEACTQCARNVCAVHMPCVRSVCCGLDALRMQCVCRVHRALITGAMQLVVHEAAVPAGPKAVESATMEAAGSSTRGSGWTPCLILWEHRAARSCPEPPSAAGRRCRGRAREARSQGCVPLLPRANGGVFAPAALQMTCSAVSLSSLTPTTTWPAKGSGIGRLWSGTRAPPLPLCGTHAAWLLLSEPGGTLSGRLSF